MGLQYRFVSATPTTSSEPFFGDDPSDVLIWSDNFDYDCIATSGCGGTSLQAAYDESPEVLDWVVLTDPRIPGNGHSIEMQYGADQAYDLILSQSTGSATHLFAQFWIRTTVGFDPSSHREDGIKGVMMNHADEPSPTRHQFGINRMRENTSTCAVVSGWPVGETHWGKDVGRAAYEGSVCDGWVWEGRADDNEGIPWNYDGERAAASPWPNGVNDGEWHRMTTEIKTTGSPQYQRIWFDGILAYDDSGKGITYPTPTNFRWFGNYAVQAGAMNGSIFVDDYRLWRR